MYSRSSGRDLRVPHNYGGSAFGGRGITPVEDLTRRRPIAPPRELPPAGEECEAQEAPPPCTECQREERNEADNGKHLPILSPLGELGTEELLLIAIALIIFQSGKEPQLALILLALLFIQ